MMSSQSAQGVSTDGLEKTELNLGFIPLSDCAPLVIAHEKGFFRAHGLNVRLCRESSWANIRDKVSIGMLDGAHMLAGMPIAASLGLGSPRIPMITAFSLNLNGNGITVSNALFEQMREADPEAVQSTATSVHALKKVIERNKAAGKPLLRFAMVFPVSSHHYLLRYWMAAAGIDPDQDVCLTVIPPPQMANYLRVGSISGYCVGEPWNALAVSEGLGRVVITSYEIWNNHPEKVLGVNRDWAATYPNTHKALLMALLEACQWLAQWHNREEAIQLLSRGRYVNAPADVIRMSMAGTFQYVAAEPPVPLPDFNIFHRYAANFPWRSHAVWFLNEMARWGQIDGPADPKAIAESVYRPEIYREAARALRIPYPTVDYKAEGLHGGSWTLADASEPIIMGSDRFTDGAIFDV